MNVVQAEALRRSFGKFEAVRAIDFSIRPGECYGFLGPNGAGKTTTVLMVQCFLPPTDGRLSVFGMDIRRSAAAIKAKLGVVSQEGNLDRDLTVMQNLVTYARYFNIPKKTALSRAEELISFFKLESKKYVKLKILSGGMLRRLAIARALINNPSLLILDEPTTGLDPQARHLIWRRLLSLKQQGVTMILTTHYMEEAERLCDRVAIMNKGNILMEGRPAELVTDTMGKEVIEVRVSGSDEESFHDRVRSMGVRYEQHGETFYLYARDGKGLMPAVLEMNHHFAVHRRTSLEDLFLHLAGRSLID
jgi:lipooligosaccharide transport system ATP-binding protein